MNAKNDLPRELALELPAHEGTPEETWGSDAIAAMLKALDIPYITLNPGASYKGFHDSLVNYLGNANPKMMLCLHEESAVAIAHGYAKASGKMMAVALHSNVGLLHASMAIFNAWCARVPILMLGATGPMDAEQRRPWIEWIHTCADQGSLVRDYVKWDNQPSSVPAAYEAMLRASQIAQTAPKGPVYINLDVGLQEQKLGAMPPLPDVRRYAPPAAAAPSAHALREAAALLSNAKRPLILAGRSSLSVDDWNRRVALAEKLNAYVLTDPRVGASFPTDHRLHPAAPVPMRPSAAAAQLIKEADVILSLDWVDLGGLFKQATGQATVSAKVINASCDVYSHRATTMEYQILPPADIALLCEPDVAVGALLDLVKARPVAAPAPKETPVKRPETKEIAIYDIAQAFNKATEGMEICLARHPIGWNSRYRHFRHPLDYLGGDGGGGLGAGPGTTAGAALALKGTNRIVAAVLGDGDFLMGVTAIWTAVRYDMPCLMIISNNRGYYNDEVHQSNVAKARSRPVENKWIGQRIIGPDVDLAMMGRAQGAIGIGPIIDVKDLQLAIEQGLAHVREGKVCVIDVHVAPGYE
ncbi:MAG: thiamine pyrophosphate-binding protein [Betaproteobacteria bacterium]|nr:thiamine pyrophosphate-binding protein [Betaproteobacteria bacterium]